MLGKNFISIHSFLASGHRDIRIPSTIGSCVVRVGAWRQLTTLITSQFMLNNVLVALDGKEWGP